MCPGVSNLLSEQSVIVFSRLSQYEGDPGMTQHTFDTIKSKIDGGVDGWAYKLCCLHVDEMEIKNHVDYDKYMARLGAKLQYSVMHSVMTNKLFMFSFRLYLDVRKFHIQKNWNLASAGKNVCQVLTKAVLFKNQ